MFTDLFRTYVISIALKPVMGSVGEMQMNKGEIRSKVEIPVVQQMYIWPREISRYVLFVSLFCVRPLPQCFTLKYISRRLYYTVCITLIIYTCYIRKLNYR